MDDPKQAKAKAVADLFYVERADGMPLRGLRELVGELPTDLRKIGDAFVHNVSSVTLTMGIPVNLADAAAGVRLWTQVRASEWLRARADGLEGNPRSEEYIVNRVREQVDQHIQEKGDLFREDINNFLLAVHESKNVSSAVSELHAQGIVLIWSAFEVLARDLFVFCLNRKPELVGKIIQNESTKRLFQLKGLDFELLSQHRFDVSHAMGDILVQIHDLGNLAAMKACFTALFPNEAALRDSLSGSDLWLLSQRRNLIVHRRGIIDMKYLDSTGETLPLGSLIRIRSSDIKQSLDTVCSVGASLIKVVVSQA
jgi:hypothetical protein